VRLSLLRAHDVRSGRTRAAPQLRDRDEASLGRAAPVFNQRLCRAQLAVMPLTEVACAALDLDVRGS